MDILEFFVRGSAVSLAVLLLAPLVGRRVPAVRHLVLMTGLGIAALLPLQTVIHPRWRPAVLPPVDVRGAGQFGVVADLASVAEWASVSSAGIDRSPDSRAPGRVIRSISLVLQAVAAAGTLLLLGLRAAGVASIHRLLGRSCALDPSDPVSRMASKAGRTLGWSQPIRVVQSPECGAPFAAGLLRPVIVVPSDFRDWTEDRQRAVLIHEAAHVARRDPWWRMVGEVALAIHWWNPWVRLVVRSSVTASEMACDDRVVSSGIVPENYAADLVGLSRVLGRRPLVAAPVLYLSHSDLQTRVARLLERGEASAPCRLTFLLAGMGALALGTGAAIVSPRQRNVTGSPESTINVSNGGPEISSNSAGVQARWVVNGRHAGIFVTGEVDVIKVLRSENAGTGTLVVIEEWDEGIRIYRWPAERSAPAWVREALSVAAEQLVGLPQHGDGRTPSEAPVARPGSRVRRPGSSLTGLPAFSNDPGAGVVQAGWLDHGKRVGFFVRGRWSRSGDTITSSDRSAWLYAFRVDPMTGEIEEMMIDGAAQLREHSPWAAEGISRINAVLDNRR